MFHEVKTIGWGFGPVVVLVRVRSRNLVARLIRQAKPIPHSKGTDQAGLPHFPKTLRLASS